MILINLIILAYSVSRSVWCNELNSNIDAFQDNPENVQNVTDLTAGELLHCGYNRHEVVKSNLSDYYDTKYSRVAEFSWMVRINDQNGYIAAGTLLNRGLVLTAAKFLTNKCLENLEIVAGDWDLLNNLEELPELYRRAAKIEFNEEIALIFLEVSFSPLNHIGALCLPKLEASFAHQNAATTAWMGNSNNTDKLFKHLFKTKDPFECSYELPDVIGMDSESENLSDAKYFCAWSEVASPCQLNNGAALFYDISPNGKGIRYAMAGIALRSESCTQNDSRYALFINILPHISWIVETFKKTATTDECT